MQKTWQAQTKPPKMQFEQSLKRSNLIGTYIRILAMYCFRLMLFAFNY